jgi:hypothetical protein
MKTQQKIEEEFDKRFPYFKEGECDIDRTSIKLFIRQIRIDDIRSLTEWAEYHYWDSLEKDRDLIVKHIKDYLRSQLLNY